MDDFTDYPNFDYHTVNYEYPNLDDHPVNVDYLAEVHHHQSGFYPQREDPRAVGIQCSVFLIAGLTLGIPALIYSVRSLYVCRKNGSRISVIQFFLLLNDFLQSVSSPFVIMRHLQVPLCRSFLCYQTFVLMFAVCQYSGLYFHQLAALESALYQKYPQYTVQLFSLPCSIVLSLFIFLFVSMHVSIVWAIYMFSLVLPAVGIFITLGVFSVKHFPLTHCRFRDRKPIHLILIVSGLTNGVYLPYVLTEFVLLICMRYHLDQYLHFDRLANACLITSAVTNLRLITDAVLCVFVCKNLSVQTSESYTELSDNLRSDQHENVRRTVM